MKINYKKFLFIGILLLSNNMTLVIHAEDTNNIKQEANNLKEKQLKLTQEKIILAEKENETLNKQNEKIKKEIGKIQRGMQIVRHKAISKVVGPPACKVGAAGAMAATAAIGLVDPWSQAIASNGGCHLSAFIACTVATTLVNKILKSD